MQRVSLLLIASVAATTCTPSPRPANPPAPDPAPEVAEAEAPPAPEPPPVSDISQECIQCHEMLNPGIVADWRESRHARTTFEQAVKLPELERRVSAQQVPEALRSVAVGCYECHSLNGDAHADNFEHQGYQINVVVSPNDCKTCHPVEVEEYTHSKKAYANTNLRDNPLYHTLVNTITGVSAVDTGGIRHSPASPATNGNTCFSCHGTEVKVIGEREIETEDGAIVFVPELSGWPNQGVGRINPDGSRGACTSCHPRHSFDIEIARKPYTCAQCHLDPDVPAWNIYKESKHGNMFLSNGDDWNWDAVPWMVGRDFKAPTCATCHNALLVDLDGDVLVQRSHDFGARLWVRLFGLVYSHPQPKSGDTSIIRNKDGLPLPTAFSSEPADEFLIDAEEQERRRSKMRKVCTACHSTRWADNHFANLDVVIAETNEMTRQATALVQRAWDEGIAEAENPFDEPIEHMWIEQWLFYSNSIRYAAAMGGADYATFHGGWWDLTKNLAEMKHLVDRESSATKKRKRTRKNRSNK